MTNRQRLAHSGTTQEDKIILIVGVLLAAVLRYLLRELETLDFKDFTGPWYDFIAANGGFAALRYDFANYTPPYLYLLVIATILFSTFSNVFAIKMVAIFFDFVCAFFIYKIVRLKYPLPNALPAFAALAFLFAPTIFLNSAFWGQADVIYTTAMVATVYFLLVKRPIPAFIAFGLAFAFKQQAIFLAPFLLILLLHGVISWRLFLLIPLVYFLAIVPAWLAGRPLTGLLLIYVQQADFYNALTLNAPNLYQWLPNDQYDILFPAGMVFAAAVVFIFVAAVYKSRARITADLTIQLANLSVLILPYFLPKMHDRYFFAADVLSIIYAFYFPRYFFIPILMSLTSLLSYGPFLFGREIISLDYLALMPIVILSFLLLHLAQSIQAQFMVETSN